MAKDAWLCVYKEGGVGRKRRELENQFFRFAREGRRPRERGALRHQRQTHIDAGPPRPRRPCACTAPWWRGGPAHATRNSFVLRLLLCCSQEVPQGLGKQDRLAAVPGACATAREPEFQSPLLVR